MQYCDICGKEIKNKTGSHQMCFKKLFGVTYCPKANFSLNEISIKAQQMAGKLSISGVQAKLSIKLNRLKKQLEVTAEEGEYILKPQIETFPDIPQNENLCMNIALHLGITVPEHSLISLTDGSLAYIVKRFDRVGQEKIHQEDFSQILGVEDKYKGSLEQIATKLKEISKFPGLDLQLFFERILLFFIIGNGDAHLKNFSIVYNENGQIRLSPAYDIVSSKLVIPDEEDFALSLNGKRNKIVGRDFEEFAAKFNVDIGICYKNIVTKIDVVNEVIKNSPLAVEKRERFLDIVKERVSRL